MPSGVSVTIGHDGDGVDGDDGDSAREGNEDNEEKRQFYLHPPKSILQKGETVGETVQDNDIMTYELIRVNLRPPKHAHVNAESQYSRF